MGLDIHIGTDIGSVIFAHEQPEHFRRHSLSRTFCNLMMRQHNVQGIPELDQIGKLTGVDISPLYDMENVFDEDAFQYWLSRAENEEARKRIIDEDEVRKEKVTGNIDGIKSIIACLIDRLSTIKNLPALLDHGGNDLIGYDYYFTDFDVDKGEGYIGNNFGQDLRNFRRFLEYAGSLGATTVYFDYG